MLPLGKDVQPINPIPERLFQTVLIPCLRRRVGLSRVFFFFLQTPAEALLNGGQRLRAEGAG